MRQSHITLIVKLATSLAVILIMAMLAGLVFQYVGLNNLKNDEWLLADKLDELVEVRENFETEYDYIRDNQAEYVEDYVREVLGWGREGEIKFKSSS